MSDEQVSNPLIPVVTQEEFTEWYNLTKELERIKERELQLRNKIAAAYFAIPNEGVNNYPLSDGWVLKMNYKINRTVDKASLEQFVQKLREEHIPVDDLIKLKPELAVTEYKKLTEDQRKLFDNVLVIKAGTPSLEVVLPKRKTS